MKRLFLLLLNELKLTRMSIPVHLIVIFQPALMYFLMSTVLVFSTFDMNIVQSDTIEEKAFLEAMAAVRSPNAPYINPVLVENSDTIPGSQVIALEVQDGQWTAVQHFSLIDSNMVKNYRNRLTATALVLWNQALGSQAITITEHPWLAEESSYSIYFGMAMLSLNVFLATVMIGGYSTAQDFEGDTIREYQLAPTNVKLLLTARMLRLLLVGMVSALILLLVLKLVTGRGPDSILGVLVILLPIAIIGGSLGIMAGLLLRKTLPAFVFGLTLAFATWILGGAFGLSAGFNLSYQIVSHFMPNFYTIELLFPLFYGTAIGTPLVSILVLIGFCVVTVLLAQRVYHLRVTTPQR